MGFACACFNLRRASRAVTQLWDLYFDEVGVKATQYTVLAALAYEERKKPTVTDLAETLVLDQSSLSRNLSVLERDGLVRLVPGSDRRERIVQLTRSGRTAVQKGWPAWQKAQAAIKSALGTTDLEAHLKVLRHLTRTALDLHDTAIRDRPGRR